MKTAREKALMRIKANGSIIYWVMYSLHYVEQPAQFNSGDPDLWYLTRKYHPKETDWYLVRCSYSKWNRERSKYMREQARAEYSTRIQQKYNVGTDWEQDRWFIEQVRPII